MKLFKYISFFLIITIGFIACRKDKVPNFSTSNETNWVDTLVCEDYPDSIHIYSHAWGRYQYKAPHFNPNNSNEFLYSYIDFETNQKQLIKYNLITKQKKVLANSGVYKQPKWNKNGWIAFSDLHHIYVVEENGSNTIQISTLPQNTFPFWNDNELYWRHSSSNGQSLHELKQNLNQTTPDTLSSFYGLYYSDVVNNNLLTTSKIESGSSNPNYYGTYNLNTLQALDIESFNIIKECPKALTTGMTWDPSGDFFYVSHYYADNDDDRGIYKITLSGNEEKIMDFCQSKQYSNISCSPDGKYIIGERTAAQLEQYDPYSGRLIQNSTIWMINTETLEETRVNLE